MAKITHKSNEMQMIETTAYYSAFFSISPSDIRHVFVVFVIKWKIFRNTVCMAISRSLRADCKMLINVCETTKVLFQMWNVRGGTFAL